MMKIIITAIKMLIKKKENPIKKGKEKNSIKVLLSKKRKKKHAIRVI